MIWLSVTRVTHNIGAYSDISFFLHEISSISGKGVNPAALNFLFILLAKMARNLRPSPVREKYRYIVHGSLQSESYHCNYRIMRMREKSRCIRLLMSKRSYQLHLSTSFFLKDLSASWSPMLHQNQRVSVTAEFFKYCLPKRSFNSFTHRLNTTQWYTVFI